MTLTEAIAHFDTKTLLARALKTSPQSITGWEKKGLIPEKQQLKIQILTNGALQADDFGSENTTVMHPYTILMTKEAAEYAKKIGGGNRSKGLRDMICTHRNDHADSEPAF